MKNKLLKDMTAEEIMAELDLVSKGKNKARLKNKSEVSNTQTVTIEKDGYVATIETSIDSEVTVDVVEETDAEFGRRVRFSIKIEEFRRRQKYIEENKSWFDKAKEKFNISACKAIDNIIEMLSN